jgi:hypothetical protein
MPIKISQFAPLLRGLQETRTFAHFGRAPLGWSVLPEILKGARHPGRPAVSHDPGAPDRREAHFLRPHHAATALAEGAVRDVPAEHPRTAGLHSADPPPWGVPAEHPSMAPSAMRLRRIAGGRVFLWNTRLLGARLGGPQEGPGGPSHTRP